MAAPRGRGCLRVRTGATKQPAYLRNGIPVLCLRSYRRPVPVPDIGQYRYIAIPTQP